MPSTVPGQGSTTPEGALVVVQGPGDGLGRGQEDPLQLGVGQQPVLGVGLDQHAGHPAAGQLEKRLVGGGRLVAQQPALAVGEHADQDRGHGLVAALLPEAAAGVDVHGDQRQLPGGQGGDAGGAAGPDGGQLGDQGLLHCGGMPAWVPR
jgi:hypothetical protein